MPWHAVRCCVLCRCAMPCFALQCFVMQCSTLRNATPCYDMLRSAVLFYAMLCRALPCIAYPLGVIALLDIRLCEQRGNLRHGMGWEGGVGRQI